MGCISSKVLTRSVSLQHQMSIKFHRTTDSITKLDDLFTNNTSSKPALDSSNAGTKANIWELLKKLEEQQPEEEEQDQQEKPTEELHNHLFKRSKSCHTMEESNTTEEHSDNELVGKSRFRSRSFHTLEEFDALLEKLKTTEDVVQEDNKAENGIKRKAYAKGLKSLQIPSNVEFPKPGSLREWLGGKASSSGEYVTPKFGSYNIPAPTSGESSSQDSGFLPDLVASLEEGMQQMEEEEKFILEQIGGVQEEDMVAQRNSALVV